jgi:hypothetical protein
MKSVEHGPTFDPTNWPYIGVETPLSGDPVEKLHKQGEIQKIEKNKADFEKSQGLSPLPKNTSSVE